MTKNVLLAKAVIFDLDGVITNTMPDHYRAWIQAIKGTGLPITHEDIYTHEGQPGKQFLVEMEKKYFCQLRSARLKSILEEKERIFKQIVKVRYIQGARTFLKQLKKEGFKLALVTGTARHELELMLPVKLYNCFDAVVTGSEVKHGKPHPEPFLRALKKLKIQAKQGVVIENAPFGIHSAKAAKLQCIALETSLKRKYLKQADLIFSSIRELKNKVIFKNEI